MNFFPLHISAIQTNTVARHFGTIEEWEKSNCNRHFKDAQVNIEVKFIVRRTGTQTMSAPTISKGGKEKVKYTKKESPCSPLSSSQM